MDDSLKPGVQIHRKISYNVYCYSVQSTKAILFVAYLNEVNKNPEICYLKITMFLKLKKLSKLTGLIYFFLYLAGTEAHSHSCRSYWCGKFCGTADCTHYVCIVLTLGKICICQNCRRIKNPYRAAQVAKSINDLDFTPM